MGDDPEMDCTDFAHPAWWRGWDIDTSDIPEVKDWSGAVVGKFYRPIKEQVCLRLDADVLNWFRRQGPGYQTRINDLLRNTMTTERLPDGGSKSSEMYQVPRRRVDAARS